MKIFATLAIVLALVCMVACGGGFTPQPNPITYTLTAKAADPATGTISAFPAKAVYVKGESVTLTATPSTGYQFDSWSGAVVGSTNPATVFMDGDKVVTAKFKLIPKPTYSLTVNVVGNGSVSKMPNLTTYEEGSSVTLNAVPAQGYQFTGWTGDFTDPTATTTVLMTRNTVVTATFTQLPPPKPTMNSYSTGTGFNSEGKMVVK